MPELPEVETVRRGLESLIVGRKIVAVDVRVPKIVKTDLVAFETEILANVSEYWKAWKIFTINVG